MADIAENGRLVSLAWQESLFETKTLPEICMALRSGVNGSSEEWNPADIRAAIAMLKARLDTWRPQPNERYRALDEAVRGLVQATVAEVLSHTWWQERT